MTVKELVSKCYDRIFIYTHIDNDLFKYKDLYNGDKNGIPKELLDSEIRCFGAKRKGVIDIAIKRDGSC